MRDIHLDKVLEDDFNQMEVDKIKHKAQLINTFYTALTDEMPDSDKLEVLYWEFYDEWVDEL